MHTHLEQSAQAAANMYRDAGPRNPSRQSCKPRSWPLRWAPVLMLAALAGPVRAAAGAVPAACLHDSPPQRLALIELYTSEGCNSCPPADRWLGTQAARLPASQALALALHVDYWDSLGWRDRFASPVSTARQRMLARAVGSHTVYTPEVFVGAREQRRWQDAGEVAARVAEINAQAPGASLRLGWQALSAAQVQVALNVTPAARSGPLQAYAALVEDGLVSAVKAGENQGATLHHERVVRLWLGPFAVPPEGLAWSGSVPLPAGADPSKLAWVAFAQQPGAEVAQAVLAPRCELPG
ncbi:DUF1223 domain-containing protein [Cupriavidus sp. D39]|uniref:DUF1223 domain-containing protein n=1 Tax=Cupriavidus sp. D39 TaxID=2997877 RepID=UPI002271954A|nr:DUF1223 domain-containing protein [Cupriavidus sp. D39]MCY0856110.1 DUF1223 domain-containing protein [Cupriavidus sp. D39]